MKAKLSFLTLPLCLGLIVTLVIAACSSGSTNSPPDGGTSNGGNVNYSSDARNDGMIDITRFDLERSGDKVYISGNITGTLEEPVVRVELITTNNSWIQNIEYNSQSGLTPSKTIVLTAEIDLTQASIECGKEYSVQLKACIDLACSNDKIATKNGTFDKPNDLYACVANSSGGGGASSSSEAMWVFAGPEVNENVILNTAITIGSGSFKLTGDSDTQPPIEVSGGTIRRATSLGGDDDVMPGKQYSSKEGVLGNTVPSGSTETLQQYEYYIIYFSDKSKYLLQFERGSFEGATWSKWPKKCTYWRATESP